jgi:hypothetical protein
MAGNNNFSTNYNIADLFQKFFNIEGSVLSNIPFIGATGTPAANEPNTQFNSAAALGVPVEANKSIYGVPIYEQVTLIYQQPGKPDLEYSFPGWPLMEVNFSKRIVKTPVTDADSTVKEFIGWNDREITIRGFIINHDARAVPLEDIQVLNAMCEINNTLKVTSEYLNALNIHYLVIENFRLPEVEASIMVQPFVIDAVSDAPYILTIQDATASQVLTQQQKARQLLLNN